MTALWPEVILTGAPTTVPSASVVVDRAQGADVAAHRLLRHDAFVADQGLFTGHDTDDHDADERTVVLVARTADGAVVGGVRVHPHDPAGPDLGWWRGSRLVVHHGAPRGTGSTLVRAACATAEQLGALRFDATVQARWAGLFHRLGWTTRSSTVLHGVDHQLVDWPVARVQRLASATKAALGGLLADLLDGPAGGGGPGFRGDDGAPVPGTDVVAACDAILPSMVERDPEWAGWCAVLVNLNDLAAMGATPTGLLDAVGARDASFARRVLRGLADAAQAYGVPVLGGHTQLGVPASLSVTALGRTDSPVPAGGGRPGDHVRLTADLAGGWRPGYTGNQWDSTTHRTPEQLRALAGVVPSLAPAAAKDVSMAGLVGTLGMLAEASGCRAVLEVAAVPTPQGAGTADWFTCFPGFAMLTAERPQAGPHPSVPDFLTTGRCGRLTDGRGVALRWPDGTETEAVHAAVTGLGAA